MKKKLTMCEESGLTLREGCDLYLDYCKQRNLREFTIRHYQLSYMKLFHFFDEGMLLSSFNKDSYFEYLQHLQNTMDNTITIDGYLRDLATTVHYLQREGYIEEFKTQRIKIDNHPIETYSDEELQILLKKPNLKECDFLEYEAWVVSNFLFTTGLRQRSVENLKIKDIDFDNNLVNVNVTKNHKALIIPLNSSMALILKEFLKYRKHKSIEDYLFCNSFGEQLKKPTAYRLLYYYNKRRGVEKTGWHRYRHTFSKNWIMSGGSIVVLSRLLGHSNLGITQNYINLLVSDLAKEVEEIDLLSKFAEKKSIKMR